MSTTARESCDWTEDFDDGSWLTECGQSFVLNDGTPEENDMKYCCYCGGNLVQFRAADLGEADELGAP